jgi:hypothetical protein
MRKQLREMKVNVPPIHFKYGEERNEITECNADRIKVIQDMCENIRSKCMRVLVQQR